METPKPKAPHPQQGQGNRMMPVPSQGMPPQSYPPGMIPQGLPPGMMIPQQMMGPPPYVHQPVIFILILV